jgi:hypothetical protein
MNSPSLGVSQVRAEPDRGGDLEVAVRALSAVGQLGARRFQLHEDFMRGAIKQFALLGEDQPARMAMEQRDVERLFERGDLPRHRRLRQAELVAGMREAAGLGRGMEDLELVPIHAVMTVEPP